MTIDQIVKVDKPNGTIINYNCQQTYTLYIYEYSGYDKRGFKWTWNTRETVQNGKQRMSKPYNFRSIRND